MSAAARPHPTRGEVWLVDLDPVIGREQGGVRPALVVSANRFNHSPAELVFLAPLTTREKGVPWQVPVAPPEGGLRQPSFIKCDDLRSASKERLRQRWGAVSPQTMAEVEDRLRILLDL